MPTFPTLPPIADQPLSVVLLGCDPTQPREGVVAAWLDFLARRGGDREVILVEDGPGGAAVAEAKHLTVLRHDAPRGEGAALRTGLAAARHPLIFYTMCDPAYRPDDLAKLLDRPFVVEDPFPHDDAPPATGKEIDHVHLMSGFRAGVPMPGYLRAVGWVWRILCRIVFSYGPTPLPGWLGWRRTFGAQLARTFFGVRYHDPTCPFRLLRRDILGRIPLQSDGPFAHVELLAKANFLGCVMGEEQSLDVKPPAYRGDAGAIWTDARRVFNHPDFGPPALPAETPPA